MGATLTSLITPTRHPPVTKGDTDKQVQDLLATFGKLSTMPHDEVKAYRDTVREGLDGVRREAFVEAVTRYRRGLCGRDISQMSFHPSPAQLCALSRQIETEIRASEYEELKREREARPAISGPPPVFVTKAKLDELAARIKAAGKSL